MTSPTVTLHGTCIAFDGKAVLIRGKPGSGKSSLALTLLDQVGKGVGELPLSAKLVSDDQTIVTRQAHGLVVTAPAALRGLLEVRGLGLVRVADICEQAELVLIVDLEPEAPRFPEPGLSVDILGISVPLAVFEAGAQAQAARLRTAFLQQTAQLPAGVSGRKERSP